MGVVRGVSARQPRPSQSLRACHPSRRVQYETQSIVSGTAFTATPCDETVDLVVR